MTEQMWLLVFQSIAVGAVLLVAEVVVWSWRGAAILLLLLIVGICATERGKLTRKRY